METNGIKAALQRQRAYIKGTAYLCLLFLIPLVMPFPFKVGAFNGPLRTLYQSYQYCLDAAVVMCIAKASFPDHRWVRIGYLGATASMVLSLMAAIAYQADSPTQFWLKLSEPIRQGLKLIS